MNFPLYSIGHGTRNIEAFLGLLIQQGIVYLIDVRSVPHSRFNPQYNQKALKAVLETTGMRYVYMGDQLGGRPKDASCYDAQGKIDYALVRQKDFFREGIQRLRTVSEKQLKAAILCSEQNPRHCHRSRLIGVALAEEGISMLHIHEQGGLISQQELFSDKEDTLFG